jgi:hypothetical protein
MGQYTIPQNIEAEDKLLGPFGFRQFVYLIIAAALGGLAYGLFMIAPPLVILPLPVAAFFLLIALPLSKDQPMEVKVAALIRFWFKPHVRDWIPGDPETLLKIDTTVPLNEVPLKMLSADEIQNRMSFLSEVVDSEGWSTRGVVNQKSLFEDDETNTLPDMMDEHSAANVYLESKLNQTENNYKEQVQEQFQAQGNAMFPHLTEQRVENGTTDA